MLQRYAIVLVAFPFTDGPSAKPRPALVITTSERYGDVLPDEKQATTVGFLMRAVAWFDGQGISCKRVLSDNGSAYRSRPW